MKKLVLTSLLLTVLCSCGKSSKSSGDEASSTNKVDSISNEDGFALPDKNYQSSFTIDSSISSFYEGITVNPMKHGKVLGDEAFYVDVNSEVYPDYEYFKLEFYNTTKVLTVRYLDLKNTSLPPENITFEKLPSFKLKEIANFKVDNFSWGKRLIDNQEYDMLNKAFMIQTQVVDRKENKEFNATSTYLVWFECKGNISTVNDFAYACGKLNLKFHYKLLDYNLAKN